ncbi:MAG: magnesium transporter, partial [Bacteroidales bacterium]|nr:magnesium transporter [Bacteroidales bacterium]
VRVNKNWNVQKCILEIRKQSDEVENLMNVYVVDDEDVLVGILPIARLVLAGESAVVGDIFDETVLSVPTSMPSEEVANLMDKYGLFVVPVVDSLNRLKGRITIDDVVDVIREEAEKDYQMQAGLTQDVDDNDSVIRQTMARLPWLFVGLLGGILSSRVIGIFEGDIAKNASLTLFLPLLAAMGGNVGVQSSSIMVQSIAGGTLKLTSIWTKILRELLGGLLIGAICSIVLSLYNLMAGNDLHLTAVVSFSLLVIIVFASLFGTFVPLILERCKIDPAIATGPFVTTTNDIVCCLLYFSIARCLLM